MTEKIGIKERIKKYYKENDINIYLIIGTIIYGCIILIYREFAFWIFTVITNKIIRLSDAIWRVLIT